MLTTIIAIYGAILATASVAVNGWIFIASGPNLQIEAELSPYLNEDDSNTVWHLYVQVSNTGRFQGKVGVPDLYGYCGQSKILMLDPGWTGPSSPVVIAGGSDEEWDTELKAIKLEELDIDSLELCIKVAGNDSVYLPLRLDSEFARHSSYLKWQQRKWLPWPRSPR
jgi:hypothetical protein